jgi:uroporphyrinogen decarboxylase
MNTFNDTFLKACKREKTEYTPVWYMRQAGRYLPEYRKLKESYGIMDIIKNPELAAQVSLQPINILNIDAAILFADIMTPLVGIGVDLEIVESLGPVIKNPIENIQQINQLNELHPQQDITYLLETIKILKNELKDRVPVIGFSAAPFTLASYMIEGKPSRDFIKTKSLMYQDKAAWNTLMTKLSTMIIIYLKAQVEAGVQALQLFDSWIGALNEYDYREYVLPHVTHIFKELRNLNVPLLHFGTNTAGILEDFASVDCDVIGVDWRISIDKAWKRIGPNKAIQGNLDPVVLLADFDLVKKHVDQIFDSLPQREGYIFNLGHGVLQTTPVDTIKRLTEYVKSK